MKPRKKLKVRLARLDGNALCIIAALGVAARNAGWTKEEIKEMTDKMTSGDYNNLLSVAMEYCE